MYIRGKKYVTRMNENINRIENTTLNLKINFITYCKKVIEREKCILCMRKILFNYLNNCIEEPIF